jgi:hypothetical protein
MSSARIQHSVDDLLEELRLAENEVYTASAEWERRVRAVRELHRAIEEVLVQTGQRLEGP